MKLPQQFKVHQPCVRLSDLTFGRRRRCPIRMQWPCKLTIWIDLPLCFSDLAEAIDEHQLIAQDSVTSEPFIFNVCICTS